jgi:lipoprotein-releasing system permease protein
MTYRIALRYLLSGKFSTKVVTVFSLLGIFTATSALILTLGVMNGFKNSIEREILKKLPHATIFLPDKETTDAVLKFANRKLKEEIKETYWYATFPVLIQNKKYLSAVIIYGAPFKELENFFNLKENLIDGNLTKDGLITDILTAGRLGIEFVPTTVKVISPVAKKTPIGYLPTVRHLKIVAIFDNPIPSIANPVLADYSFITAKGFKPDGFTVILKLKNPYKAKQIADLIESYFPEALATSWIDSYKEFFSSVELEKLGMVLVVSLILIVAAFNISSLLFAKVKEMRRDIAIFRAFGVGRDFIFKTVLFQGSVLALLGSVLGIVFSLIATFVVNKYKLISLPKDIYMIDHLSLEVSPLNIVGVFIFVMLISLLAAYLPARTAVREKVTEILRND